MGDCNVCIGGYDDGEPAQLYQEKMVKARRQHRCYECGRPIQPGSVYERVSGRWEGEFSVYCFCIDCSSISRGLSCGDGRMFGNLWDDVTENLFPEMTTGCLQKIDEPSAKAYLIQRWQEWKGLRPKKHLDIPHPSGG